MAIGAVLLSMMASLTSALYLCALEGLSLALGLGVYAMMGSSILTAFLFLSVIRFEIFHEPRN